MGVAGNICFASCAVLVTAACSVVGGATGGGEPPVNIARPSSTKEVSLPLDVYLPTPVQVLTLERARNSIIVSCMGRFGFSWKVTQGQLSTYDAVRESRFYVTDSSDVSRYGYHPVPGNGSAQPSVAEPANGQKVSLTERAVIMGEGSGSYQGQQIPPGGCSGEASRKLAAGWVTITDKNLPAPPLSPQLVTEVNVPGSLMMLATARAGSDSRIRAMNNGWSACMKRSGYDYSSPQQANNDARWGSSSATQAEISTAAADVQCKKQVNYLGVTVGVLAAYQKQLSETHAEALSQYKSNYETSLKNAARVLAGQPL